MEHCRNSSRNRPLSADDPGDGRIGYRDYGIRDVQGVHPGTEYEGCSLLKGLLVFFAALVLSYLLHLNGINYILNKMVEWGVLA